MITRQALPENDHGTSTCKLRDKQWIGESRGGARGELDDIRRNQDKVEKSDVKDILARVKVADSGYTFLL